MPITDVELSPEVNLRRFYKTGVNFSENVIFKKLQYIAFKQKIK